MADGTAGVLTASAVAHLDEQLDDQLLEQAGRSALHLLQNVRRKAVAKTAVRGLQRFFRGRFLVGLRGTGFGVV
jgi:hypothetical protein